MFDLEDLEKAVRKLFIPYLQHNHPNSELLSFSAEEIVSTTYSAGMEETSPDSGIPVHLFWSNALQLVFDERPEEEWLTSYHLCRKWAHDYQLAQKQGGAPSKIIDRSFVFLYVGYLSEIKEISRASAYKQVASLFKHPVERIELWCKDKHRYNEERGPVDEFIEFAKILKNGSEDEIVAFFREKIPSLFE